MADRETREFTTPGGHKVVLHTYLTGREANEVKGAMFSALSMSVEDAREGKVNIGNVSGAFLMDQEKKALSFLVVSVDGDASAPMERLLDLPSTDYDAVVAEANKIQNPTTPEK